MAGPVSTTDKGDTVFATNEVCLDVLTKKTSQECANSVQSHEAIFLAINPLSAFFIGEKPRKDDNIFRREEGISKQKYFSLVMRAKLKSKQY